MLSWWYDEAPLFSCKESMGDITIWIPKSNALLANQSEWTVGPNATEGTVTAVEADRIAVRMNRLGTIHLEYERNDTPDSPPDDTPDNAVDGSWEQRRNADGAVYWQCILPGGLMDIMWTRMGSGEIPQHKQS